MTADRAAGGGLHRPRPDLSRANGSTNAQAASALTYVYIPSDDHTVTDWDRAVPAWPELRPAGSFSDADAPEEMRRDLGVHEHPGEIGPLSRTVTNRLTRSCAGWTRQPTAAEFYRAVRSTRPDARQREILYVWGSEAEWHEILAAHAEGAYTLRDLAEALHRCGYGRLAASEAMNRWSADSPG